MVWGIKLNDNPAAGNNCAVCMQGSKMFSIYLSSSSRWMNVKGFISQPARLLSACFRISPSHRHHVGILWVPGRRLIYLFVCLLKKPFWWAPVPLWAWILFEMKSWGRGDLVRARFASECLMGSPAGAWCGNGLVSPFSRAHTGSHPAAEISLCFFLQLQIP